MSAAGITRFRARDFETRDVTSESGVAAELEVAELKARLLTQNEPGEDFARIPVAQIVECRADKQVVLDDRFIPTVLRVSAAPRLTTFLQEMQGLLHQRAEALAARAVATGRGGAAEIADFLCCRRSIATSRWWRTSRRARRCHPEDLYTLALQVTGELSTLTATSRRPPQFPSYRHDALRASYEPVINALRACLNVVLESNAIPIPLAQKKYGISVATIADKDLFDTANFVLAARADLPPEDFRRRFPAQLKIGTVEKIRDLVMLQLPGIGLQPMAVAPRQIPYHAGFVYFELDKSNELWRSLKTSGGVAFHQAGEFPGSGHGVLGHQKLSLRTGDMSNNRQRRSVRAQRRNDPPAAPRRGAASDAGAARAAPRRRRLPPPPPAALSTARRRMPRQPRRRSATPPGARAASMNSCSRGINPLVQAAIPLLMLAGTIARPGRAGRHRGAAPPDHPGGPIVRRTRAAGWGAGGRCAGRALRALHRHRRGRAEHAVGIAERLVVAVAARDLPREAFGRREVLPDPRARDRRAGALSDCWSSCTCAWRWASKASTGWTTAASRSSRTFAAICIAASRVHAAPFATEPVAALERRAGQAQRRRALRAAVGRGRGVLRGAGASHSFS